MSEYFSAFTQNFDDHLPLVLSNEGLTEEPYPDEVARNPSLSQDNNDVRLIAGRLRQLCSDIRVMFVIREQRTSIESYYFGYKTLCIHVAKNYPNDPLPFEEWYWKERDRLKTKRNYYEIIKKYADTFGSENIQVFLYETLKTHPEEFVKDVCTYVGVDVEIGVKNASNQTRRTRLSSNELKSREIMNKYFPSWKRWRVSRHVGYRLLPLIFGGDEALSVSFPASVMKDIESNYGGGNKALDEMFGLQMSKHDYIVNS